MFAPTLQSFLNDEANIHPVVLLEHTVKDHWKVIRGNSCNGIENVKKIVSKWRESKMKYMN